MAVQIGQLPSRYADPELIGRGGMGEIYRATDTMLDRTVAVKVLSERYAHDDAVRERFTREALAVARLSDSRHIVTIYDVGEWEGLPFFVMEYVPGGSLEEILRREGAQSPRRAVAWLEQAATALDRAHGMGIVHRDVKPANLLLDVHGEVTVVDFGIASAGGLDRLTQTGMVLGTASYLPPEQAQGERATAAGDQYSLAVVAFEVLAGRRPFEADSVAAEAALHVTAEIPSACAFNPRLPRAVDTVFARGLAKDPRARYPSCAQFVAALRAAFEPAPATTAVIAAPRRPLVAVRPVRARRRWPILLLALLAVGAAGGLVEVALLSGRHDAAPPRVKTVTQEGTTVLRTVTAPPASTTTVAASPTTAPASTTTRVTSPLAGTDPHALNDRAWSLMKQGNYEAALPLLEEAVGDLQGQTSDIYDAYANYNLGVVLTELGRCSEALPHLETARQLEPGRSEVQKAITAATSC